MIESEYNLAKSKKALGPLYPILKAKDGSIIDGFHRQNDDPDWASITVEAIDTPVKLELARLAANFCRRQMPATEFQNRVAFLVKSGLKVSEIAEQTGISETTIRKYEPQELKDQVKAGAGRQGGISATQARQTVKIQDTVQCDRCHVSTSTPIEWHNHKLCQSCYGKAEADPDGFNGYFTAVNKKPEPHVVLTTDTPRSLDSWETRKAQMSPQHSKFEGLVIASLIEAGVRELVQDRRFCILETVPDIYLPSQNLAIYLDGEAVHANKQDRDEQLRDLLAKRTGLKVHSYTYDSASEKEVERVTKEILSIVKVET
jgi:hypothetical protein